MSNRTWNLKLAATGDQPETTLQGLSQDEARLVVYELMHGTRTTEPAHLRAAIRRTSGDERPVAV